MKTTVERELKLEADGPVELDRLGGRPLEGRVFTSTYFDTPDLCLLLAGVTLRRRLENGLGVWQLKLPSADARIELEEPGGPAPLPGSLAAVLSGLLRGRELKPIAALKTHRSGRHLDGVDVTLDEVEVLDGESVSARFAELEAELVDGSSEALDRIGQRLIELGARSDGGRPKLLRVVDVPTAQRAGAGSGAVGRLCEMFRNQRLELLRNDPVLRVASDLDAVHDMRVAVRRLRSILRTARPMLRRQWVDSLRSELDWLAQWLGAVRDLDVFVTYIESESRKLGHDASRAEKLLPPLQAERERAREQLRAALGEPRYYRLLDAIEAAAEGPRVRRSDVPVEKLAKKEFRRFRTRATRISAMGDHDLHKLRIHAKRARYAAELAEPARARTAARFIKSAKEVQDILGEHQDAVVAGERVRRLARTAGGQETGLAAGRLIERQELRKQRAREEAPEAVRRMKRRGKQAWLD
jgi:CHAD domain-containing protein